jgi:hypothetical protein
MEYLVLAGVAALIALFGVRKFNKASQGKDCCK